MFSRCIDLKSHNTNTRLYGMHRINATLCCNDIFGGGDTTTINSSGGGEIRFATYVETYHENFLSNINSQRVITVGSEFQAVLSKQMFLDQHTVGYTAEARDTYVTESLEADYGVYLSGVDNYITKNESPYLRYHGVNVDNAFFGAAYVMTSFPSLYDMYGKFMAGLDLEALFAEIFEDATNAPEINNLVAAESTLLDDDIEANVLPRFELGARDINSVMSSSFIIGKSVIEEARVKSIAKFSAELKYKMIPVAVDRWKTHLTWNTNVVTKYMEVMKTFFSTKQQIEGFNHNMAVKHQLWPFTVMQFEAAAQGALTGTQSTTYTGTSETSTDSSMLSNMLGMASGALSLMG